MPASGDPSGAPSGQEDDGVLDPDALSDGELAAERDELAAFTVQLDPDELWDAWVTVGWWSFLLHGRREDPEDLRLAVDALDTAFALSVPGPGPGDERYEAAQGLRADAAVLRSEAAPEDRHLLAEAVALVRSRLDGLGADGEAPGEQAMAHVQLADLHLRLSHIPDDWSEAPAAQAAARHYASALALQEAGSPDVAYLRERRAAALLRFGRGTGDRTALAESLREFARAVDAARAVRDEELDRQLWETGVEMAFGRFLLWVRWQDVTQPALAEEELNTLLAAPDALDVIAPGYLDAFGRILHERAAEQDDDPARDRAIALLHRAVQDWRPEEDGEVEAAAAALMLFQLARYVTDGDPGRLPGVVLGAQTLIDGGTTDGDALRQARVALGMARAERARLGLGAPDPEATEDAARAAHELSGAFTDGRLPGFDESSLSASVRDVTGSHRIDQAFDRLYADWLALQDAGQAALVAGQILLDFHKWDPHGRHVTEEQVDRLFRSALTARTDAGWQVAMHSMVSLIRTTGAAAAGGIGVHEAAEYAARAGELAGDSQDVRDAADFVRAYATIMRGQLVGGADDVETTVTLWRRIRDSELFTPYQRRLFDGQFGAFEATRAVARGDLAQADLSIGTMAGAYRGMRDEDISRIEMWTLLEQARQLRNVFAESVGAPPLRAVAGRPDTPALRIAAERLPHGHRAHVLGENGIVRSADATAARDARALTEATDLLVEAMELSDEGGDTWFRYAHALAQNDCVRALLEQSRAPLDRGIAVMERSRRHLPGPEHRLWGTTGLSLGTAYRQRASLRGPAAAEDRRAARRVGLEALRGHTWAALLQSGTDHAAEAASKAVDAALDVAEWCLEDGMPHEAVRAVDSCRALLLHASITSRSVPERLEAAGRADLAGLWRTASTQETPVPGAPDGPGDVPSDLRRRVLEVLAGTGATGRSGSGAPGLLDPPEPAEIAAALRATGSDALAYLLPARGDRQGCALLVTADGRTHTLPLPLLREDAGPIRDYRPGGGGRDMGPAVPGPRPPAVPLRAQLDRLCSWAWFAATEPLLAALGAPGREPSIVLAPLGALGAVPWHAAWEPGIGGARRYAVAAGAFSYTASARMLCDVASRPAAPHTGAALVVGNPTGDLRAAGDEARAVHEAFYPAGRFRSEDATPAAVLDWLRRPESVGGVLHLACHGSVAEHRRLSAFLSLAGGRLAAESLTEAGAGARGAKDGFLELVVLAACRSQVSGRGPDEAYSLSTAFLVAGANSVVGSLWPVPDDATSVLMFMTHHFLRRTGRSPGRALRRAQLWMLDPARVVPEGMPRTLRRWSAAMDPDDLPGWAGFTHLGR
ncbi:CHAT domain-containing protein [Streptomyces rubiginosohelvolus]|uniref:CHAT domain-containing protein n=1 Tax=Streptomyces rubiginosohelvolus TaxID=67362 RepID=UPI0035DAE100